MRRTEVATLRGREAAPGDVRNRAEREIECWGPQCLKGLTTLRCTHKRIGSLTARYLAAIRQGRPFLIRVAARVPKAISMRLSLPALTRIHPADTARIHPALTRIHLAPPALPLRSIFAATSRRFLLFSLDRRARHRPSPTIHTRHARAQSEHPRRSPADRRSCHQPKHSLPAHG